MNSIFIFFKCRTNGIDKGNAEIIDKFPEIAKNDFRSYAQLVWSNAVKVGCGLSTKRDDNKHTIHFYCRFNYGNVDGNSVYKRGIPCSQCQRITFFDEDQQCSTKYEGLCGEPTIDMTWKNSSSVNRNFYLLITIFNLMFILRI